MAIELVRLRNRKLVAWLEATPPADGKKSFEDRGYTVIPCTEQELKEPAFLSKLVAIVFTQSESKPLQITRELENNARNLLDFDCRIILRPTAEGRRIVINKINRLKLDMSPRPPSNFDGQALLENPGQTIPLLPYVRCAWAIEDGWNELANFVTENPPGPAPNLALKIIVEQRIDRYGKVHKVYLPEHSKVLLRRAFADCNELHLVPLDGGRSGVGVFRACAELAGVLGQWTQPYFVKIGRRRKILAEYKAYVEKVDPYVPFHLGPNLLRDRCCLGSTEGVIVGDFVEESESLGYCAYDGRSASAIACLFDRTLLGWHRQASEVAMSFSASLLKYFPETIGIKRMEKVRKLGSTQDIDDLRSLLRRCSSARVCVGPIHGDLHAANVRVRATDAIVIDFFAHREGPLLYDAATLEASLLVEGFGNNEWNSEEWFGSVESLYNHSPLSNSVKSANQKSKAFWFHACVVQIRRYARQWEIEKSQYAAALALALLVKASKDSDVAEPEASRRAAAYVFAERILLSAFGVDETKQKEAVADFVANQQKAVAS